MTVEIMKSVETIADYAKAVDDLGTALNKYMQSSDRILTELNVIRENEGAANTTILEIVAQIQEHAAQYENMQREVTEGNLKPLLQVVEQASAIAGDTLSSIEDSCFALNETVKTLEPQVESIHVLSSTLENVQNELQHIPQLADTSRSIQKSLGTLGDTIELAKIADKLDEQITEIKQEREEIIAPLKNAAAFSNVVHTENQLLSEKLTHIITDSATEVKSAILERLIGNDPDSACSKLDSLISTLDELKDSLNSSQNSPAKTSGLRSLFGIGEKEERSLKVSDTRLQTAEKLFEQSVCIIEKPGWTNDFVFVIDTIREGFVYGNTYRNGKLLDRKKYPADDEKFRIYTGPYTDDIAKYECEMRSRTNSSATPEEQLF